MEIDGSNILVTGGAGLIGSTTIDLLLREHAPARIVVLDNFVRGTQRNLQQASTDPRLEVIRGDVRNVDDVRAAMRGVDTVLHMAALRITACAAEPREAMEVMCDGSFNVVDQAREAGVRRVVASSSASIYGLADVFPTPETHPPYNDQTWYGATKTFLEGMLRAYRAMYGLEYVTLRYFNVYGPRMDVHGRYTEVLIRWMERIARNEAPLIFGDGRQTMDFVHVEDIARANVLALLTDNADQAYNVGSGVETSLLELAAALLQVMGANLVPEHGPERSVNPVSRRLASTEKAERLLGFKARIDLRAGLDSLVQWWEANRSLGAAA
ncbi:MAG: NAD-dependent epimerase/dehydratase family protein [Burkholderiaceae bacterium]|nr:NAD-dependent epimerase/dehydratase family protein [Burkholderiaceae bacterium]